ncbi:hypothetical protein JR065_07530 [Xanthomonas sp. AmX2]|uniref:hypothetical protein n=1 Tax=Xanthomonas sp. TaxID=29446 RepID=UPI00197E076E|nr:hypothetical protein [Xanthomonas sp.]MBN6150187.1 hypothetical protein [Xanthomonas sp.]
MASPPPPLPTLPRDAGPAEWKAIEQAAAAELARRAQQAHAQIVAILSDHARFFSDAQRKQLRRRLDSGRRRRQR